MGRGTFTDQPLLFSEDCDRDIIAEMAAPTISDPKQWSTTEIEMHNLDCDESSADPEILDKAEALIPLLEEWSELASNPDTYRNSIVTASVRVAWHQPMIRVDTEALLRLATTALGARPDPRADPTSFCFFGAALINPLPALGVSLESRRNLLEVSTIKERVTILEKGLLRSIQNLKGERPLYFQDDPKENLLMNVWRHEITLEGNFRTLNFY
jgi:hypothetical protein